KLPPEQQDARLLPLTGTITMQPLLVSNLAPAINQFSGGFRRSLAELRATIVAVAAERFRLKDGRWPSIAEELVPKYLARVPADPCDGQPLRYRQKPYGVVIYSIGSDGVDNGGAVDPKNPTGTVCDWGVRLWDLAGRRRSPLVGPPGPEE